MTVHELAAALLLACGVAAPALAANPVPHQFTAGTAAKANEVNANFDSVVTQIGSVQSDVSAILTSITSLQGLITAAMPTGTVLAFSGDTAPPGFLLCDGQGVSRTTYAALFSVIGMKYGSPGGVGGSTFNVPDLRGMFVRGKAPANVTFTDAGVNTVTEQISAPAHGFTRSGIPVRFTTNGALPGGLNPSTTFWIILVNADTFGVASTEANALAGTPLVDLTTPGGGTHTAVQWSDPDAGSRTALAPGGATGNNVGAKQEDASKSHTHGYVTATSYGDTHAPGGGGADWTGTRAIQSDATGGGETRPRNVAMNYIIKF
jgi:microcystin-dependent protein